MPKPNRIYCVSFLIDNPPGKGGWEWVDYAVEDETGMSVHGDFGDGCTAIYEFRDDKEGAVRFLELLKNAMKKKKKKTIGKHHKFTISDFKIFVMVPTDGPAFWKEVPFEG